MNMGPSAIAMSVTPIAWTGIIYPNREIELRISLSHVGFLLQERVGQTCIFLKP